jgi:hypothetical protein
MRIGDRESLTFPEKPSSRRYKRFTEDNWSDGGGSQKRLAIIQSLDIPAQITRVESLEIVGRLSVAIEPRYEWVQRRQDPSGWENAPLGFRMRFDFSL